MGETAGRRQRVQAVETAAHVLFALVGLGRSASLGEVAAAAGLPPAKAHRYLASLVAAGLAEQVAHNGAYRLGHGAMMVGLAALRQSEFVEVADEILIELRNATGVSCFSAIFGNKGPTIIRQAESTASVVVNVRPGSVLPVVRSATGRVFAAFLPDELTAPLIAAERREAGPGVALPGEKEFRRLLKAIEHDRMSAIDSTLLPGIAAISVPVFDHRGMIAGALTALGPSMQFDLSPEGPVALCLRDGAAAASRRLGFAAPGPGGA